MNGNAQKRETDPARLRRFDLRRLMALVRKESLQALRDPSTLLIAFVLPVVLLLLFAYAVSWIMAWIGLLVPSPEVVNNASFMVIFPLTFIANTFVPTNNFPGPLKAIANWNPVSSVTQAARDLFGNTSPNAPAPQYWSLQHPVLYTLGWVVLLLAVFIPLSVLQYKKAASR